MVSDAELVLRLREIVRESDLNMTTVGTIRRKLEKIFEIDLSEKKAFIREHVDSFLQNEFGSSAEGEHNQWERKDDGVQKADQASEMAGGFGSEIEVEDDGSNERGQDEDEQSLSREDGGRIKAGGKNGGINQNEDGKKRGGGFSKLCDLSPRLQNFVGVPQMARTQVVKNLWAYIREKKLQDPSNKRNIICDEELRALFGVSSINMFQMNKALSKHIWPLEEEDALREKSVPKRKQATHERGQGGSDPSREKRRKGGSSGFLAALPLSDALVKFLGTGEGALSRAEVVKRMWEYIKKNNLQDPSDKRRVICDEKLKELFEMDDFQGFTVTKLLTSHFVKPEQ